MKNTYSRLIAVILASVMVLTYGTVISCAETGATAVCSSVDEAAAELRSAMKNREESAGICLVTDIRASESEDLMTQIFDSALIHTGEPDEGDYLKFQYNECNASAKHVTAEGADAVLFTYSITYYDTAEQERETDEKVAEILGSLDLENMTDREKTDAVYRYICDNTEYDYECEETEDYALSHTAYAALVEGKAVCQGYSAALYRLLLEAGIDNRIVFGTGINSSGESEDHTWNIVKLDDRYYNIDITRGDELGTDAFYLKGSGAFDEDHIRSEEYRTEEFTSAYAIPDRDYGASENWLLDHITAFSVSVKQLFRRLIDAL